MLETFVHWGWGQTCTDSVDRATALEAGTQRNPLTDPQAKGSRAAAVPGKASQSRCARKTLTDILVWSL